MPVPVLFAVLEAFLVSSRIGVSVWSRRQGMATWFITALAGVLVVRVLRMRR